MQLQKEQANDGLVQNRLLSLVDLFAGCGGLSLGFENSGFTPVFVSELNKDARDTYLYNRTHELGGLKFNENDLLHCGDANKLTKSRIDQLKSDLKNINEIDFQFDNLSSRTSGGGSSIDILAGGPPCQGFSGIGIRRNWNVERKNIPANFLFKRMCNVISQLRPKIFLFENVRGILNAYWDEHRSGRVWDTVLSEFKAIPGYQVKSSLVLAKDYGAPQNRPRVLLVGIRKDILSKSDLIDRHSDSDDAINCGFLPAKEQQSYPDLIDLLGDLVDPNIEGILKTGNYPKGEFETNTYPTFTNLHPIQEHLRGPKKGSGLNQAKLSDHVYSKHKKRIVEKFSLMISNSGKLPSELKTKKFSQRLLPKRWGSSGPNITATSLPDDYIHFSQPRILTVREWARLQLFPDWYEFKGQRTTGGIKRAGNPTRGIFDREVPKYTQIGNAVPVCLAQAVANHFKSIILDAEKS